MSVIGLAATAGENVYLQEEVALKDGMTESNRDVDPDCFEVSIVSTHMGLRIANSYMIS